MKKFSLLDSAMGSELIHRGETLPDNVWSAYANLHNPEQVYKVHLDNIEAGSQIITANTFRTTSRAYAKTGLSSRLAEQKAQESLSSAIHLAHKAANKNAIVLGSIAPLEDCYIPELFPGYEIAFNEFSQLGRWMKVADVDGIILETMNSISETRAAMDALSPFDLPIYISYYLVDAQHLGSGESLNDAIYLLRDYSVQAVLMNCSPVNIMSVAVDNLVSIWTGVWGIYPNLGKGKPAPGGVIKEFFHDDELISLMGKALDNGAEIIGGCCGSSPRHIALMKNEFSNI